MTKRTTLYTIIKEETVITNTTTFPGKKRTETQWVCLNRAGYKVITTDSLEQLLNQIPLYFKHYDQAYH